MSLPSGIVRAFVIAAICVAGSFVLAKVDTYPEPKRRVAEGASSQPFRQIEFNDERLYLNDQRSMFWLDDHQILYSSYRDEELNQIRAGGLTPEGQYRASRVIRIFDLNTGAIRDHALMAQGLFCFSKGNILYQKLAEPRSPRVLLWGPVGQEKEDERIKKKLANGGFNARIRCSWDEIFEYRYPSYMIALQEEHGMVEVQYSGKGQEGELWLHSPNFATPILIEGYAPKNAQSLGNQVHQYQVGREPISSPRVQDHMSLGGCFLMERQKECKPQVGHGTR